MRTRDEHMAWCKARALALVETDPVEAATSMLSDLGKHPATEALAGNVAIRGLFLLAVMERTPMASRKFIEGFR